MFQHYLPATNMLAQTTLRAVLGQHELDEMLSERKKLSTDVRSIIDSQTEIWGIKVSNLEIRTVELRPGADGPTNDGHGWVDRNTDHSSLRARKRAVADTGHCVDGLCFER
jgi:hypothetical protein